MAKWHDFISPDELADTASYFNDKVADSRKISADSIISVASMACDYYGYLEDSDAIADAIRYDVQSFAEYATLGYTETTELEFADRYSSLLAAGHPHNGFSDMENLAGWISGAPELSREARHAIVAALSPKSSEVEVLHANTRLFLIAKDGELSDATAELLELALSHTDSN